MPRAILRADEVTNVVGWFDMKNQTFGTPRVLLKSADMDPPTPCVSAEATLFSHFMVVFGGWSSHALLPQLLVLDLNCWECPVDHADLVAPVHIIQSVRFLVRPAAPASEGNENSRSPAP
jgi:hypothetical protein